MAEQACVLTPDQVKFLNSLSSTVRGLRVNSPQQNTTANPYSPDANPVELRVGIAQEEIIAKNGNTVTHGECKVCLLYGTYTSDNGALSTTDETLEAYNLGADSIKQNDYVYLIRGKNGDWFAFPLPSPAALGLYQITAVGCVGTNFVPPYMKGKILQWNSSTSTFDIVSGATEVDIYFPQCPRQPDGENAGKYLEIGYGEVGLRVWAYKAQDVQGNDRWNAVEGPEKIYVAKLIEGYTYSSSAIPYAKAHLIWWSSSSTYPWQESEKYVYVYNPLAPWSSSLSNWQGVPKGQGVSSGRRGDLVIVKKSPNRGYEVLNMVELFSVFKLSSAWTYNGSSLSYATATLQVMAYDSDSTDYNDHTYGEVTQTVYWLGGIRDASGSPIMDQSSPSPNGRNPELGYDAGLSPQYGFARWNYYNCRWEVVSMFQTHTMFKGTMSSDLAYADNNAGTAWCTLKLGSNDVTCYVVVNDWLLMEGQKVASGRNVIVAFIDPKLYVIAAQCEA